MRKVDQGAGWQRAERRDRLIWSMHREGRTQVAIGKALEVPTAHGRDGDRPR
jgi:hypothetical protein